MIKIVKTAFEFLFRYLFLLLFGVCLNFGF